MSNRSYAAAARAAYFLSLPVLLVAAWWLSTPAGGSFFVPSPGVVGRDFVHIWFGERFVTDVLPSIVRLSIGLIVAIAAGIGLGLVVGSHRRVRLTLEPLLEFFRAIPATILIPVLLLLIGINDAMKVTVIVVGTIWPVLLNTVEGVRSLDSVLDDSARIFGIRGLMRFRHVVLPAASPQIMAGVRSGLSLGLILMVVSEMFAASEGLGFAIIQSQRLYDIPAMWSGVLLLGIIGIALALIFTLVERWVLAWYFGLKEHSNEH